MLQKRISFLSIATLLLLMFFATPAVIAQCKIFVKSNCVPQLHPYIHDGSYQAVIMSEGEEAEVYKTIFAGQKYRLYVCADNSLPNVEIIVSDVRRNILFDNRKNSSVKQWDFKPEASQQIKVTIRVPKSQKKSDETSELIFGCVGMLFGILEQ
jgi:hypothetical protein